MIDIAHERTYPTPYAQSPLLPLLLLSLASQKHSPSTTKLSSILPEYDFIIVGAGSAGSTLASRLSELACVNILLLEAGKEPPLLTEVPVFYPFFVNSDVDWAHKTTPQEHAARLRNDRRLPLPGGKMIGGTSSINTMLFVRGNKENYNNWAAQGATGWSYNEVLPYFKKMEDNKIFKLGNAYHGFGGPVTVESSTYTTKLKESITKAAKQLGFPTDVDANGQNQTGFSIFQTSTRHGQRCSTAKAYLVPADSRANLHILPNAFVTKIVIKNKQAEGVVFEVKGKKYQVRARREVIMSAGTINTAQLLMVSGVGPKEELQKHNIPVIADLPVGKNLQDQCIVPSFFVLNQNIPTNSQEIQKKKNFFEYITFKTGVLSSLFVNTQGYLSSNPKSNFDFPNYLIIATEAQNISPETIGVTQEAYTQKFKPYENKTVFSCLSQVLQPKSRGDVKLQSSNPHDMPIINPNYLAHPQDVQDIVSGLKTCYRIGLTHPLKLLGSDPFNTTLPGCEKFETFTDEFFQCEAKALSLSVYHIVGTAKMGDPSDPTTVVDSKLRVKGVKGLRVVDASIMPTITSGNTNVPTIMIAEKASDIIKKNIQC